jgi:hypothetical protein
MNMPSICIYTAMFAGYDSIVEHEKQDRECDFVVVTDDPSVVPVGSLRTVVCKNPGNQTWPALQNAWLRLFPSCISELRGYDILIYLDPNARILEANFLERFVEQYRKFPDFDLMLTEHPWRDCVYEEALVSQTIKKYANTDLERQMADYRREGFPAHGGLYWNGLIVNNSRCNQSRVDRFRWKYWSEITKYNKTPYAQPQAQVSLPYCLWKADLKLIRLPQLYGSSSLEIRPHLRAAPVEYLNDGAGGMEATMPIGVERPPSAS